MSVNKHLLDTASKLIITDVERSVIDGHIQSLRNKLTLHFGLEKFNDRFVFGSYARKTLMPRRADGESDVDYMIAFADTSYAPTTYLDWLRKFAEAKYSRSEIYPSHPTVVLELSKIKIELVPAIKNAFDDYQIPAPTASYDRWLTTHPTSFKDQLSNKNTSEKSLIRPMIRLMKYWNAKNDYPYSSYELEQLIVNVFYYSCNNLWDYISFFVNSLTVYGYSASKASKINALKTICIATENLLKTGYPISAEAKIQEAFPIY